MIISMSRITKNDFNTILRKEGTESISNRIRGLGCFRKVLISMKSMLFKMKIDY